MIVGSWDKKRLMPWSSDDAVEKVLVVMDSDVMAGGASIAILREVRRWVDGARKEDAVAAIVRQIVRKK